MLMNCGKVKSKKQLLDMLAAFRTCCVILLLNMKQGVALGVMQSGKSIFLTGQAGSGKTYILNKYIDYLRAREIEPVITASTGIAATHIGGVTIHSWAATGIKSQLTDYDIELLQEKQYLWKRFESAKVLIIDEISMISPDHLDSIDRILRAFRFNAEPFGGLQVIFSGDFFQLPPVQKRGSVVDPEKRYAWHADVWDKLDLTICYLEEQHRQSGTSRLNSILNEIREGAVSEDSMNLLRGRYRKEPDFEVPATKLYTHNIDVDSINEQELRELEAHPHFFDMTSKGNKKLIETLKKGTLAQDRISIKEEARVLFVKNNYEKGYMNGSVGVVTGFSEAGWPEVELVNGSVIEASPETWSLDEGGKVLASVSQVPLRLAWAITVHKSQGMSLDTAEVDLSKSFESGQGYVALSRLRSLAGLKLMGLNQTALSIDPVIREQDARFLEFADEAEDLYQELTDDEKLDIQTKHIVRMDGVLDEEVIEENKKGLKKKRRKKISPLKATHEETKDLIKEEYSLEELIEERGLAENTIIKHLEILRTYEPNLAMDYLRPEDEVVEAVSMAKESIEQRNNKDDFTEDGTLRIKSLYEHLGEQVSYEQIKLALVFLVFPS